MKHANAQHLSEPLASLAKPGGLRKGKRCEARLSQREAAQVLRRAGEPCTVQELERGLRAARGILRLLIQTSKP